MRQVHVDAIESEVAKLCIEANYNISNDIKQSFLKGLEDETSEIGKDILNQLLVNSEIAASEQIPICQDTGMAIVFVEIGQDVSIKGGGLKEAINNGVRKGYEEGYLRKSVVKDPLIRINTNDNTPAIIHYDIVSGDGLKITVAPKGFGSENMSRIYMLKPADGVEGVIKAVVETVEEAGPNPCPPIVVGVGIGGSFEKAALLSKKALLRTVDSSSKEEHIKSLEKTLLNEINKLGIGPQGLGGKNTALGVNVETYPTHIAGLPVAINISCHVTRHVSVEL